MLFGDEKRFTKPMVSSQVDRQILAVQTQATDEYIGPGAYFNNNVEEKRNGWASKSFSKRQPMTPSNKGRSDESSLSPNGRFDRSDYYTSGVMTSYGTISAPSPRRHDLPGPGYYEGDILKSPRPMTPRRQRLGESGSVNGGPLSPKLPTTPRFSFSQSTCMKDGVIFQSAENERKMTGPGYYNVGTDTLTRSSFNVRASNGKSSTAASGSKPRNPSTPRMRVSRDNSSSHLAQGELSPNPGSSFKADNNVAVQRPRSSTAPRQRVASSYSTPLKQ